MSDYALTPAPALGGHSATIGGISIEEVIDLSIVSIAVPRGNDGLNALNEGMQAAYGASFPAPGQSTVSSDGKTRFLGMAPDQAFAIFTDGGVQGDAIIRAQLQDAGYYTLQSDNWVVLRVSGAAVRAALARICQIDLDPDAFAVGRVARTVMEHMGAIVLRDGADSFVLMSAWSSAQSFLHAVETSARNVL